MVGEASGLNGRRALQLGAKALHVGFGSALAACLVINPAANRASPAEFAAARHAFAAIAQYVLVPAMAVVVVSGLIALAGPARHAAAFRTQHAVAADRAQRRECPAGRVKAAAVGEGSLSDPAVPSVARRMGVMNRQALLLPTLNWDYRPLS